MAEVLKPIEKIEPTTKNTDTPLNAIDTTKIQGVVAQGDAVKEATGGIADLKNEVVNTSSNETLKPTNSSTTTTEKTGIIGMISGFLGGDKEAGSKGGLSFTQRAKEKGLKYAISSFIWDKAPWLAKLLKLEKPQDEIKEVVEDAKEKVEEVENQLTKEKEKIKEGYNETLYGQKSMGLFYLFRGSNDFSSRVNKILFKNKELEEITFKELIDNNNFKKYSLKYVKENKNKIVDEIYNTTLSNNNEFISKIKIPNINTSKEKYVKLYILSNLNIFTGGKTNGEEQKNGSSIINNSLNKNGLSENSSMIEIITKSKYINNFDLFSNPGKILNWVNNPNGELGDIMKGKLATKLDNLNENNITNFKIEDLNDELTHTPELLKDGSNFALMTLKIKTSSENHTVNLNEGKINYDSSKTDQFKDENNITKNFIETNLLDFGKKIKNSPQIKKFDMEGTLDEKISIKDLYSIYLITGGNTNLENLNPFQQTGLFVTLGTLKGLGGSAYEIGANANNFFQKITTNIDKYIDMIPETVKNILIGITKAIRNAAKKVFEWTVKGVGGVIKDAFKNRNFNGLIAIGAIGVILWNVPIFRPRVALKNM